MPGRNFSHHSISPVSVEQAWGALQKPETWGRIGGVNRIENATFDHEGNLTGYRFVVDIAGTAYRGTALRGQWDPPHRMAMAIDSEQLTGQINVEISSVPSGTEVTVEMAMEPAGFFGSMLFPVLTNAVAKGFPEAVERFVTDLAS